MALKPIGPFFGINNKLPVDGLRVDDRYKQGNWLRDAVNVEVDNGGEIRRRLTERRTLDLSGAHSLYSPSPGDVGYVVADRRLYHAHFAEGTLQSIAQLTSDAPMSYVPVNGRTYWSNGVDIGWAMDAVVRPAALPTPLAPSPAAVAGGSLPPGKDRVWVSYYDAATGEAGPLSPASAPVELSVAGGLALSLPPPVAGATHAGIHLTSPNGGVALHAATVDISQGSYLLSSLPTGSEATSVFEAPLP
ncbi:MAG: hypothetical protein LBO20_03135, partial [Bifidobacteriaceae bacterium]|nr:hypothetical protein [Bifidobacteriaceae bacterium]